MKNKALIVDDEEIICELGQEMFDMLGHEAFTAYDQEAAVEIFTNHHQDIGLVIIDLNLEKVTGIDVFKQLQTIDPDVNGALASGQFIESDAPQYQAMGFKEILTKPYGLSELKKMVEKYLSN